MQADSDTFPVLTIEYSMHMLCRLGHIGTGRPGTAVACLFSVHDGPSDSVKRDKESQREQRKAAVYVAAGTGAGPALCAKQRFATTMAGTCETMAG